MFSPFQKGRSGVSTVALGPSPEGHRLHNPTSNSGTDSSKSFLFNYSIYTTIKGIPRRKCPKRSNTSPAALLSKGTFRRFHRSAWSFTGRTQAAQPYFKFGYGQLEERVRGSLSLPSLIRQPHDVRHTVPGMIEI